MRNHVPLSACNGALPNSDFEAREAGSNPTCLLTRQIVDPSYPETENNHFYDS